MVLDSLMEKYEFYKDIGNDKKAAKYYNMIVSEMNGKMGRTTYLGGANVLAGKLSLEYDKKEVYGDHQVEFKPVYNYVEVNSTNPTNPVVFKKNLNGEIKTELNNYVISINQYKHKEKEENYNNLVNNVKTWAVKFDTITTLADFDKFKKEFDLMEIQYSKKMKTLEDEYKAIHDKYEIIEVVKETIKNEIKKYDSENKIIDINFINTLFNIEDNDLIRFDIPNPTEKMYYRCHHGGVEKLGDDFEKITVENVNKLLIKAVELQKILIVDNNVKFGTLRLENSSDQDIIIHSTNYKIYSAKQNVKYVHVKPILLSFFTKISVFETLITKIAHVIKYFNFLNISLNDATNHNPDAPQTTFDEFGKETVELKNSLTDPILTKIKNRIQLVEEKIKKTSSESILNKSSETALLKAVAGNEKAPKGILIWIVIGVSVLSNVFFLISELMNFRKKK